MMGHRQVEQAVLFYEFSLERHVPADHLLRSIDSGTRRDGQSFELPARYTFVIVMRDGGWRIAHQHSSPRPKSAQ